MERIVAPNGVDVLPQSQFSCCERSDSDGPSHEPRGLSTKGGAMGSGKAVDAVVIQHVDEVPAH